MDICQRENLYQVDLLSPASKKITEKEYWASRKGQKALNKLNQEILADGLTPMNTRYLTQKQFIREAVDDISTSVHSFSDFKRRLWEKYEIEVFDKRGRFSYRHPERENIFRSEHWETIMEKHIYLKYSQLILFVLKSAKNNSL